jgi:hypothetical protein
VTSGNSDDPLVVMPLDHAVERPLAVAASWRGAADRIVTTI